MQGFLGKVDRGLMEQDFWRYCAVWGLTVTMMNDTKLRNGTIGYLQVTLMMLLLQSCLFRRLLGAIRPSTKTSANGLHSSLQVSIFCAEVFSKLSDAHV